MKEELSKLSHSSSTPIHSVEEQRALKSRLTFFCVAKLGETYNQLV
uniref:Uncharacterized protein n=1 Tax=Anguilla anguilla TaxID=7936 RepID=A0A0E9UM44_ANGAN